MNIFDIIQGACAIIAIVISVISLIESNKQVKLSNKQFLFEKRIKTFVYLKSAADLCGDNLKYIQDSNRTSIKPYDYIASLLTNSVCFSEIYAAFEDISDTDKKRIFLIKQSEIKEIAEQSILIFPKEFATYIKEYLLVYLDLL